MPRAFDRMCLRCGWDNQVAVRKCLHCRGMISLQETLNGRAIVGSGLVIGLLSWYFLGPLLGAAIGLAISALGSLVTLGNLRFKCGGCGRRPEGRLFTPKEQRSVRLKRLAYVAAAIALAGAALQLYLKFRGR